MEEPADPYSVLGVERDASEHEIQSAYRRLAREYHPDRFSLAPAKDQAEAAERMTAINAAWEILGSAERRGQYDQANAQQRQRLVDLAATLGPGFGLQLWGTGGIRSRHTIDPITSSRPMRGQKRYITAWAEDLSPLRKLYPDEVAGLWLLHGRDATDDAMEHIGALPWLEVLDLRDTAVTSLGIARLKGFDRLWSLNLAGTLVSDTALETIATLISLQELSLVDTSITDACVPHLLRLTNLRVLNLEGTRVSNAAIRELLEMPSLEIFNVPRRLPLRTHLWVLKNRRGLAVT